MNSFFYRMLIARSERFFMFVQFFKHNCAREIILQALSQKSKECKNYTRTQQLFKILDKYKKLIIWAKSHNIQYQLFQQQKHHFDQSPQFPARGINIFTFQHFQQPKSYTFSRNYFVQFFIFKSQYQQGSFIKNNHLLIQNFLQNLLSLMYYCKGKQQAVYACSSRNCQISSFICSDFNCCSEDLHKDCLLLSVYKIQESMEESHPNFQKYVNQIKNLYEGIIKSATYQLNDLKTWSDGHYERQKCFLNDVKLEQVISGDSLSKLVDVWNIFSEDRWTGIDEEVIQIQKLIQKQLSAIKKLYNRVKIRMSQQRNSNTTTTTNLEINSAVVWKQDDVKALEKLLNQSQSKIQHCRLLYRASQNDFSAQKFHKSCDGVTNVLVLAKTSKDKIIGGFTPVSWQASGSEYKQDKQGRSFVFSLTNQQIYPIVEKQFAIEYNISCGPIFGRSSALWIYDSANENDAYWHILPMSYQPQYAAWTEKTFQEFIGAKMYEKFTIAQWEVFQVNYE